MTEDLRTLLEEKPAPKASFSIQALISFICGIIAYLILFLHSLVDIGFVLAMILAPLFAIVAIFTGHRAKKLIRNAEGVIKGKKLANIGLFLGYLYIIVAALVLVLALLGLGGLISALNSLLG